MSFYDSESIYCIILACVIHILALDILYLSQATFVLLEWKASKCEDVKSHVINQRPFFIAGSPYNMQSLLQSRITVHFGRLNKDHNSFGSHVREGRNECYIATSLVIISSCIRGK